MAGTRIRLTRPPLLACVLLLIVKPAAGQSIDLVRRAGPPTSSKRSSSKPAPDSSAPIAQPRANGKARAIEDGLAWLARHQRTDGIWDRDQFDACCPPDDRCSGTALYNHGPQFHVAVTSLGALAFLGAGHTHEGGPYARNLTRAFEFLLARQKSHGSFDAGGEFEIFNTALAALAVAEASAATRDPVFDLPLRRAVAFLASAQQERGGWDYQPLPTGRNDTAITSWVLLAFQASTAAGAPPPIETVWRMAAHFDAATQPDGRVWYADEGKGVQLDRATGQRALRYGPATCAMGLAARSILGWRCDEPIVQRQIGIIQSGLPSFKDLSIRNPTGLQSEIYWLFGSIALRRCGGDAWSSWNAQLRDCILEYQERPERGDGTPRHAYGSWTPYGNKWGSQWGRMGGRVYSTAMNLIALEISYGRQPAFLSQPPIIGPVQLRHLADAQAPADLPGVTSRLARFHPDAAEPVLLRLMRSPDPAVRLSAALVLADFGSPMACPELRRQSVGAADTDRGRIARAIERACGRAERTRLGAVSRVDEATGMLLFDMGAGSVYYEQRVQILRDGRPVGAARVERRFSDRGVAAARLVEGTARAGDQMETADSEREALTRRPVAR